MSISEARIETEQPSRFLVQFCKHANSMGSPRTRHRFRPHASKSGSGHDAMARGDLRVRAEWSDTDGTVTFDPWGSCVLHADGNALTIRVEATAADELQRIQDIVANDLDRFGRHSLTVQWQPVVSDQGTTG